MLLTSKFDKLIHIFLVEDDNDDVELLKEALNDNHVVYEMKVIRDGEIAAQYIESTTYYPDIILLDLNLPRVRGHELLKIIKRTPVFKSIPVFVLTTSNAQKDIDYVYREGAERYLTKPTSVKDINAIVDMIVEAVQSMVKK